MPNQRSAGMDTTCFTARAELLDAAREKCRRAGVPLSAVIRTALERYVEEDAPYDDAPGGGDLPARSSS